MSQWFPALDDAFGGIATTFENTAETAGDTAGNFAGGLFGGLFGGLGQLLLTLAAIAAVAYVLAGVL